VDILIVVALLTLPLGAAAVLSAVVLVAAGPCPWTAVVSAALAVVLMVVWVLLSYRDGVRADAPGASGNAFSQVGWLVAAIVSGATALGLQKESSRRSTRQAR